MPHWQLVMIAWGQKYRADDINVLYASVKEKAQGLVHASLITDRPRAGLDAGITLVDFPQEFLDKQLLGSGCQAKLAMFQKGLLRDDLPAIYLDLDTVILGDVSRLLDSCPQPQNIAILQSAVLPFGALGRFAYRLSKGRRYARGNSSAVVFHPAHSSYIAQRFLELFAQNPKFEFRPMCADERFISWCAQPVMRAISTRLMVKFPTEFMYPWTSLGYLRTALPWVRARRQNLVAITLPGLEVKPAELSALDEGARVVDRKGRQLIWSARYLGPTWGQLRAIFGADRA